MAVVRCSLPGPTGTDVLKSENSAPQAGTKSRSNWGHKLRMIILISLWAFNCRDLSEVAGKSLVFPADAPPSYDNVLSPAAGGPLPMAYAPSPASVDAPQHSATPTHSSAPKQSDPPTQSATPMHPATPTKSAPPTEQPAEQLVQFQQVLSSLRANNYTTGAQYISEYLFLLPLGSTLFVPTNAAFGGVKNDYDPSATVGPVLAYHAILQQLSYQQIALLPVGTRFVTMIANNNTIEITSVAPDDLRLDDVRVVQQDVCSSDAVVLQISCHGVDGIFNMTEWGRPSLAPIASHAAPVPSLASAHAPNPDLAPTSMIPPTVASPAGPTPAPA